LNVCRPLGFSFFRAQGDFQGTRPISTLNQISIEIRDPDIGRRKYSRFRDGVIPETHASSGKDREQVFFGQVIQSFSLTAIAALMARVLLF
jgi:hypothetical protein